MYGRRYSPLSSSGWAEHPSNLNSHTGGSSGNSGAGKRKSGGGSIGGGAGANDSGAGSGGHQRVGSEATSTRHQKTLDEIVETLKVFTTRCNIVLEPLLEMTDFLSTSRTATSATTRPALTTLFVRLLAITPFWIALTLPPWRIITTKRVALIVGTILLSWHSRPARVSRTLLWRTAALRQVAGWITGLEFDRPTFAATSTSTAGGGTGAHNGFASSTVPGSEKKQQSNAASALTAALKRGRARPKDPGVRFTFILYENQRRWVALGWTSSLFAYERAAWTDEQNHALPPKDQFELPEVEDAPARWRWVEGSRWRVDGVPDPDVTDYDGEAGKMGWIYYDNKWQLGRRGLDGWGRWTRRRKWYRDAELVEKSDDDYDGIAAAQGVTNLGGSATSPAPPALPPRARSATRGSQQGGATDRPDNNDGLSSSLPNQRGKSSSLASSPEVERGTKTLSFDNTDAASTASSKSRFRFPTPSLRRRTTGGSVSNNNNNNSNNQQSTGENDKNAGGGAKQRRPSDASSHGRGGGGGGGTDYADDDSGFGSLTPALELEIQGHHRELGSWGYGDDVQMGLE
ncbi:Integral peroxisomal membrane peroxin [Microdochium nivale]|nr:Integral peroxisomal membrane peroxin [Microdochium nivale]